MGLKPACHHPDEPRAGPADHPRVPFGRASAREGRMLAIGQHVEAEERLGYTPKASLCGCASDDA